MQFIEDSRFEYKIKNLSCFTCGAGLNDDTIMPSIFWNGKYYCQVCGKDIIERWRAGQTSPMK